jgi:hypothetical protein
MDISDLLNNSSTTTNSVPGSTKRLASVEPEETSKRHRSEADGSEASASAQNTDMMDIPDSPPTPENTSHGNDNGQSLTGSQTLNVNGGAKGAAAARGSANKEDPKINFGAPGSSWNTKKFNDEYDREYNKVIDKEWAREFSFKSREWNHGLMVFCSKVWRPSSQVGV